MWHEALLATLRKYNINASIQAIRNLYNKAKRAVLFNGSTGDWFRTTVGVQHGCLLSPTFFNFFVERITKDAMEDHKGNVSNEGHIFVKSASQNTLLLMLKRQTKLVTL